MIIYILKNKFNGKCYIGQTTRTLKERWRQHCWKESGCSVIHEAIRKYGEDAFEVSIVDDTAKSIEQLNKLEEMYIKHFNSLVPNGYNLTTGGFNYIVSKETKAKMSNAQKGKIVKEETKHKNRLWKLAHPNTEDTNKKIAAANKGKKRTAEQRLRWEGENNPFYGRTHSTETKKKISKKHRGKILSSQWKINISKSNKGKAGVNPKLTVLDVKFIKHFLIKGFTERKIGEVFGVSKSVVNRIRNGQTWKHVK